MGITESSGIANHPLNHFMALNGNLSILVFPINASGKISPLRTQVFIIMDVCKPCQDRSIREDGEDTELALTPEGPGKIKAKDNMINTNGI